MTEKLETNQKWTQLSAVQIGGAVCLPIFIIGHALEKGYGLTSALFAIVLGNLILMCMGFVLAGASACNRKSTAECAIDIFGASGKAFFSLAMVIAMMGWYAIQLNVMTVSMKGFLPQGSELYCNLVLGILMTFFGLRGIKGLEVLSNYSLPVLIATIGFAVYMAGGGEEKEFERIFSYSGVSFVIGAAIGAVVDLPTFFRHSRSQKDAFIAIAILFGVVIPILEGVGVYLSYHSFGDDIVAALMTAEPGLIWSLWVLLFLILAGWTTNNANLYSASVSMRAFFPGIGHNGRVLALGIIGTLMSCMNFLDHLENFLSVIGIILSAMGAVMVVHYLFDERTDRNMSLLAWGIGAGAGFCSLAGISFTEIPVLDAFAFSLISMGCLSWPSIMKGKIEIEEKA